MRKLVLFTMLMAVMTLSFGQQNEKKEEVPTNVLKSFLALYPEATKVLWQMEDENVWEGNFMLGDIQYSAEFTSDGIWIKTEHEIELSAVPAVVMAAVAKAYPEAEIEEAEEARTPDGTVYEFDLVQGEDHMEVVVNADGTIMDHSPENDEIEPEMDEDDG